MPGRHRILGLAPLHLCSSWAQPGTSDLSCGAWGLCSDRFVFHSYFVMLPNVLISFPNIHNLKEKRFLLLKAEMPWQKGAGEGSCSCQSRQEAQWGRVREKDHTLPPNSTIIYTLIKGLIADECSSPTMQSPSKGPASECIRFWGTV